MDQPKKSMSQGDFIKIMYEVMCHYCHMKGTCKEIKEHENNIHKTEML
jgi:hypothetical protein